MSSKKQISVRNHKDYQTEVERLEFTKEYIKSVLKIAKGNKEQFVENLKEAFAELDTSDSSLSYMNLLTNAQYLELAESELERLASVIGKPYFSRINFTSSGDTKEEILYIGKASLFDRVNQIPIIVDWRSPIANVYYDGRLGNVTYDAYGETQSGYLSLKRQYEIENGLLKEIRDIDLTTHDELLQKSLSGKADNRLTEIVATIQNEQNEVIRASLKHPIIVQGAAGSGKTTIALHRISYFLYSSGYRFPPEKLMILAPNRLFIDYISAVLPDLGVNKIKQTTYIEFMRNCLGKKLTLISPNSKLMALINGNEKSKRIQWVSSYKGSLDFKELIDHYLKEIEFNLAPSEDFMIEKSRLMRGGKLKKLFINEFQYLPIYKRLDKIKNLLANDLRIKKSMILSKINSKYDDALEKALFSSRLDSEKRTEKVVSFMDSKEKRISMVEQESKVAIKNYMAPFVKKDIFTLYKELMTSPELLQKYSRTLSELECKRLSNYCQRIFAKKALELEDLAPIFYMKSKLEGIEEPYKMKSVFIDEAQDYSYFQFAALKEGFETELFTIVGDLAQGIHSYRGLNSWEPLVNDIFPNANYQALQKSYRTTVEIMHLANDILSIMDKDLPKVEPVIRHGDKPCFTKIDPGNLEQVKKILEHDIDLLKEEELNSMAIIGRTDKECLRIHKMLENSNLPIQLLEEKEDMKKGCVVILPSYLSKGLEFDAVLILTMEESYREEELDIKLLYVAMTRPMHRLYLYASAPSELLLNRAASVHFDTT
ncbi:UvrD-helicase domain-containing protein [Bacillus sp. ISL-40]|uniref:RNA polymerase recycling motor HelD n=1 Tax=unclassified Bacillus (in: firmicutes) TaxID=185979 RepID=UPI001BE8DB98|nr:MULTISPECIES: RNA polymerase recycling motor HelD [unclassified Bacillus (in: firmicutes)]MBT2698794.1 UvrD-helicase domain-containing protein [Bacillus sp. ISL-40]MBT2720762.1 UvrD-helicase domain-containing protein [Bacillus sp. ISL-46]MBT2740960.1 UvrD-helicase domain-containing protein [Bacillus sp. ISL-77]